MTDTIDRFDGRYRFLSNFHVAPVTYKGVEYKSAEHAYQAAKCSDEKSHWVIRNASTPGQAKKFGKNVPLRPDWDRDRVRVMTEIIAAKFAPQTALATALLGTGDAELIEGNWWGDKFWGVCDCEGENQLGRILMARREELRPKAWTMPAWMEPYRDLFNNTGGNSIENLMNRDPREANVVINAPVALICTAVESQIHLLTVLHNKGLLKTP